MFFSFIERASCFFNVQSTSRHGLKGVLNLATMRGSGPRDINWMERGTSLFYTSVWKLKDFNLIVIGTFSQDIGVNQEERACKLTIECCQAVKDTHLAKGKSHKTNPPMHSFLRICKLIDTQTSQRRCCFLDKREVLKLWDFILSFITCIFDNFSIIY